MNEKFQPKKWPTYKEPMRLLIVDDSAMMRRTITRHVNNFALEIVATASSGDEALELVQIHRPDAVTLDITMPGMDGLTCLEKIMDIAPATKVIVITALSDKLTGLQAIEKGAVGYIFKPIDEQDIQEAFEELLTEDEHEY